MRQKKQSHLALRSINITPGDGGHLHYFYYTGQCELPMTEIPLTLPNYLWMRGLHNGN